MQVQAEIVLFTLLFSGNAKILQLGFDAWKALHLQAVVSQTEAGVKAHGHSKKAKVTFVVSCIKQIAVWPRSPKSRFLLFSWI